MGRSGIARVVKGSKADKLLAADPRVRWLPQLDRRDHRSYCFKECSVGASASK